MLQQGQPAPDARIAIRPREWKGIHELRDGRPAVLLFFPLAFSSTCREEMCTMAEDHSRYRKLGVDVYGISIDSPYVNARFAEETGATFPILSDFNKEATRAYDVYREDLGGLLGVSERAVFVIDAGGTIAWTWQGEHPGVMPPFDQIEAAVHRVRGT
ncbi:MAG: redoxin domain-containing protein [Longimicrobiales bacterium]